MDGVPEATQPEVNTDGTFTYDFVVRELADRQHRAEPLQVQVGATRSPTHTSVK
jgi:FtsP/CotA-like multicopper oxidase with cupredoxin domain